MNKNYIRWLVIGLVLTWSGALLMGMAASRAAADASYQATARLVGTIRAQNPELEEAVLLALKNKEEAHQYVGEDILKQYGYTQSFGWTHQNKLIKTSLLAATVFFFFGASSAIWLRGRKRKRIGELTDYLYRVNCDKNSVMSRNQEDDFALLEDEIYKTVTKLRQTKETALKARKSLADNLADIAHQIKTPITSIALMTELLSDSRENSEDHLYIEKIQRQLGRLEYLIAGLLTLSKLDAGTLEIDYLPVDLYTLLTGVVESVEELVQRKNQKISIQSGAEVSYLGDMHWSMEAILNLVKNCSEHTQEGGVITLAYEQNPIYTQILVEDNGPGFAKEDIQRVFERFYRGKNADKNSVGIGLALAKAVMEKQNGTIKAENKKEGGARFVINLYNR